MEDQETPANTSPVTGQDPQAIQPVANAATGPAKGKGQQAPNNRPAGAGGQGKGAQGKGPAAPLPAPQVIVRPLAPAARASKRHWGVMGAFVGIVIAPVVATALYMYGVAQDRYASTMAFTVRSEEGAAASDLLGGLSLGLSGGGTGNDSDILYEFIHSQEIVRAIDAELDLRTKFSQGHDRDPLMTFDPSGTIEDLTAFWERMLRLSYDGSSGLMEIRVLAFTPEQAQEIAKAVLAESTRKINALSDQAREDATRYASEDLTRAEERLRDVTEKMMTFRITNEIVDPQADIQGQMGLLATLQAQLAEALIEFDLISDAGSNDPRIAQAQRRIDVIQARIDDERNKFGATAPETGGSSYAQTIAEYERLTADRLFAEQAHMAARTAFEASQAEAQRQSRYLAAYIQPTLAERADFPQRGLTVGMVALFAFLLWAIGSLAYYALRDRR